VTYCRRRGRCTSAQTELRTQVKLGRRLMPFQPVARIGGSFDSANHF
jgi:hypothetical protein